MQGEFFTVNEDLTNKYKSFLSLPARPPEVCRSYLDQLDGFCERIKAIPNENQRHTLEGVRECYKADIEKCERVERLKAENVVDDTDVFAEGQHGDVCAVVETAIECLEGRGREAAR